MFQGEKLYAFTLRIKSSKKEYKLAQLMEALNNHSIIITDDEYLYESIRNFLGYPFVYHNGKEMFDCVHNSTEYLTNG